MQFGEDAEVEQAAEIADGFRRVSVKSSAPPPIFHPLAYRGVVAEWPVEWRERWGRRANELEETGMSWRDAETQAFIEVWTERRREQQAEPAATAATTADPERN
jgi:hypothetical protein